MSDQVRPELPDDQCDPILGTFLWDIGTDPDLCLWVLYRTSQIWQRRSHREVVGSEGVSVLLTPEHADMEHRYLGRSSCIPFSEFRSAVEEHWVVVYRANSDSEDRSCWRPGRIDRPDLTPAQRPLWCGRKPTAIDIPTAG
ncbi:hypothetical protein ACWDA3_19140 [Nonomuraea rubra]